MGPDQFQEPPAWVVDVWQTQQMFPALHYQCWSQDGQRHGVSADHAEALHPKAHSFTDAEGKEEKKNQKKIGAHSIVPREQLTERKAAFRSHRGETKQRGE